MGQTELFETLNQLMIHCFKALQLDCIQVHLNELECREKVNFFLQVISKRETFIYFRFIACKVKHFKSFFVLILMIRAYSSWKSKISISKY